MNMEFGLCIQPIDITFLAHPKFLDSLPDEARSAGEKVAQAALRLAVLQRASSGLDCWEWAREHSKAVDELMGAALALGGLLNLPPRRGHHTWEEVRLAAFEDTK